MLDKRPLTWYNDLMTTTQIPQYDINWQEADHTVDAIGDAIEAGIAEYNKQTQLYILKRLEDVVANLIFDRTPQ